MSSFSLFYDPALYLNDEGVREAYGAAGSCASLAETVFSVIRSNVPWEVVADLVSKLHQEVEDSEYQIETMYEDFAECGLRLGVGGVDEISAHAAALALAKWVLREVWTAATEPERWFEEFTPAIAEKRQSESEAEFTERIFDLTDVRDNYPTVVKHFMGLPAVDTSELKTVLKQEAILAAKARRARSVAFVPLPPAPAIQEEWRARFQGIRQDFAKAADSNPKLHMMIVRTLAGSPAEYPQTTAPSSVNQELTGNAYHCPYWAFVFGDSTLTGYVYGPSEHLRTFDRLARRAWCSLPETLRQECLQWLKSLCPVSAREWPRDQLLEVWPHLRQIPEAVARDLNLFEKMTAPHYNPDWPCFVYWKLKQDPGSWFQQDQVLCLSYKTDDGQVEEMNFRHDQEHFAEQLRPRTVGRWRVTRLMNADLFSASLAVIDMLLHYDDTPPAAAARPPAGQDGRSPAPPVEWSTANLLGQWAKVFGVSGRTMKRRLVDGTIKHKKLSSKTYQIAITDLPAKYREQFRNPGK